MGEWERPSGGGGGSHFTARECGNVIRGGGLYTTRAENRIVKKRSLYPVGEKKYEGEQTKIAWEERNRKEE